MLMGEPIAIIADRVARKHAGEPFEPAAFHRREPKGATARLRANAKAWVAGRLRRLADRLEPVNAEMRLGSVRD